MPKKEYEVVGAIFKNDYGYNLKLDVDKLPSGPINLFVSPPHPDYVKDTSPEYFIKIQKDAEEVPEDDEDTPF